MTTRRLSKKIVDALPVREAVYVAYDDSLAGFGCRVTPKGARSWIVEYRPHGGGRRVAKKRITLGRVSVLTPDQARQTAAEILAKVRLGHDVPHDRAGRRSAPTLSDLADRFMREEIRPTRKPRTSALYEMYFRVHILPPLGVKLAREITVSDVAKLHRKIGTRAPVTANRVATLISALFSWAVRRGQVPEDCNPARGITRYREKGRERFLSDEEIARLGDTLRQAETVGLPWIVDASIPRPNMCQKLIGGRRCHPSPLRPFGCCCLRVAGYARSSIYAGRSSIATEGCCSSPTARPGENRSFCRVPR